ncbi:uncharacterized protein [Triticum aestivum]|uniref:uncharacterized protein n=1 Tax=Triticum aestivum TaxID=4565 RepID=UPI001D019D89|nr:uncharacterized protein LOC123039267 [Triticum aestivum]
MELDAQTNCALQLFGLKMDPPSLFFRQNPRSSLSFLTLLRRRPIWSRPPLPTAPPPAPAHGSPSHSHRPTPLPLPGTPRLRLVSLPSARRIVPLCYHPSRFNFWRPLSASVHRRPRSSPPPWTPSTRALESTGAPSPLHGRLRAQGGGAHRVQKGGGAHRRTRRSGARRRPRASRPGAAAAKDHLFKGSQDHPGLVPSPWRISCSSRRPLVVQDTHVFDLLEPKEQEVLVLEDAHGKTNLKGLSKNDHQESQGPSLDWNLQERTSIHTDQLARCIVRLHYNPPMK